MRRELIRFLIGLALVIGLVVPSFAGGAPGLNTWTGSGPFATGLGNRTITALAASPDGVTLYAGTGSGTVFIYVIDTDNDGLADNVDNCPAVANADQTNTDGDLLGDACDSNDDNDAVLDPIDNCRLVANSDQADSDGDGLGNACDSCPSDPYNDSDTDGVCGNLDNCPLIANADQVNSDTDNLGDACDGDDDNDGIADGDDVCPLDNTNDADNDGICGLSDNCPAVANADQLDSDGDGFGNACDLAIVVTPATMATDDQGSVQLTIGQVLAGATVTVEQLLDVNGNGQVDTTEPALRSFTVTDGVASTNPNVLADTDGTANGEIAVALTLGDVRDRHHLPGNFLFWVGDGGRTGTTPFAVTTLLESQSISGTITDGTNPVPGALVTLQGKGFTDTGLGAFTNSAGQYRIEVPAPGDYHVVAEDGTGQWVTTATSGDALVPVTAGQHATGIDRTLIYGSATISGNAGAPGVNVRASNATGRGQVLANADGTYQLLVPNGSYDVSVQPTSHLGLNPSSKGLVGQEAFSQSVDATSDVTGVDFTLTPATTDVSGTVRDEFGVALPGMNVVAINNTDPALPVAMAVTAANGAYTLGLNAANPWSLSVNGEKIWPQDLLSSYLNNYSTVTSPATGNDLMVYAANAWIIGTVTGASGQPLGKVKVYGWSGGGLLFTGGTTDMDGTYRLPARGGQTWTVDALTEDAGQGAVDPQSTTLTNGQTVTLNFAAPLPPSGAPASINVPASDPDGSYTVSWGASTTAGVTYYLQEATDAAFTTGVRWAYSGTGASAAISGRTSGKTYYYRVRAQKAGYTASDYLTAGNGCTVTITCAVPASLSVPATSATGDYVVTWDVSATADVNYVLQEASNAAFTTGLRQVYLGTATSASITGRNSGVTYYYRVRAQKAGYTVSAWTVAGNGCVVTLSCAAAASISVPATNNTGSYTVTWEASTTAAATYYVQEATNSAFTAGLREVYLGTATSASITERSSSTTYYYRVRAQKAGYTVSAWTVTGNGCRVAMTCAVAGSLTVPATDADGNYTINWGASTTSGASYELQEATNSTFAFDTRTIFAGTALSAAITGRSQNTTYYYRVRAVKAGMEDSWYRYGANSCAVPGGDTVEMPASLTVSEADADGAYPVSWAASATAGVTYELQEATASNFSTGLRLAYRGMATTYDITGRSQNVTYYYRVRAVKGGLKDSGYHYQIKGCAVPGTATAGIPVSVTVPTADPDGNYTISWAASATAGVLYEVQEATSSSFTTGLRNVYRGSATTFDITGRSFGETYYYRVRAVKGGMMDSAYQTAGNGCWAGPPG